MRIQEWKYHPDFPAGNECLVRGCWEFELEPGEATISHQHEDGQEIDLILDGSGRIHVGELTRDISAGDVIFVPPGRKHFIENVSSPVLRGITIESVVSDVAPMENVSVQDLEDMIASIPDDLDVSTSLQIIIRLFDLAGYISEHIDRSIGIDNDTGYDALKRVEQRVMDAVVEISYRYQHGASFPQSFHPRF